MERITNKQLEAQLERLAKAIGVPYGHYIKTKPGEGTLGKDKTMDTLPNGLDFSFAYGGVAVHQLMGGRGETGVRDFFQSGHVTKREMYTLLNGAMHMVYALPDVSTSCCGGGCGCSHE